ncbi:MAG: AMP-binding protein [Paracoccaceae bacterium]|nr:AMP-binding protein [Paracoccaceae bacterium]
MNQADFETLHAAFVAVAGAHPDNAFLAVPAREGRDYDPDGREITYGEAHVEIDRLIELYRAAGYGTGHRVALLLENKPEHFLHLLAFSALGISLVSINPDYTHDEMLYQMEHSDADLAVVRTRRLADVEAVGKERKAPLPVVDGDRLPASLPRAPRPPRNQAPGRDSELALFYTSGTTGRPKGCVVTNHYFLATGAAYLDALRSGDVSFDEGEERVFNPLPLYHVNACVISFGGVLQSANCQIQPDRFHPSTWWSELAQSRATIFHYLGVVPPMLLNQPESPDEKNHGVKFGLGAGIEPALHAKFEERFNLPLYEGWGMTETGRIFAASGEPRHIDTRAFGRPSKWMTGKIVDENDNEVPRGTPGELVVWTPGENPRDGFFSGYLKNEAATEESWKNGFFHTGDTVIQREDDMFVFVDRSKNIIRRSGENIAAAEIEACLAAYERVANIAVLAVPDELREEEVMACVVAKEGIAADEALADALMALALEKLSYFKAPGWWLFVDALPTTGTQKVQKQQIFPKGTDPRAQPGVIDRRDRKKRQKR